MKKIVFFGFLSISLASCINGNNVPPGSKAEVISLTKAFINSEKVIVANLEGTKNGKPTDVKISLKINIPEKNFNTKMKTASSTDGFFPKQVSDIQSYEVFLSGSNLSPVSSIVGGAAGVFIVDLNSSNLVFGTHTVTFSNVPVGTWFAVVKVFDAPGGTGNNITAPKNYGTDGILQLVVSSNSVMVNSDLSLTPANGIFNVSLDLQNGKGASIDTEILPVEGASLQPYDAVMSNTPAQ